MWSLYVFYFDELTYTFKIIIFVENIAVRVVLYEFKIIIMTFFNQDP